MEVNEKIERFKDFIENNYKAQLYDIIKQGRKSLVISFNDIVHFDPTLADELLEDPEDTIRSIELAIEQFDLPEGIKNVLVRLKNLPDAYKVRISNVRSSHLGKFLVIQGIVRQASDIRPQVTSAKFECAGCGNTISILQIDTKFKEPSRCTCGWRGKFRLLSKDLIDVQHLKVEEAPESLEGGEQPKRLSVFLKEDLVEPRMERKTAPGSKINIYGIVKEVPIQLKTGAQSVRYDLVLEANNIEPVQEDYSDIIITRDDEDKIKNFVSDGKAFEKLAKAMAPSIYGHERIKEALVLQLFGGVRRVKPDGTTIRGDMHVLLVGDPGCIAGDSQVALYDNGVNQIKNLGDKHLQPIKVAVTKIRKNEKDKAYDFATVFHKYLQQPVLRLVTETGKEIICTYNQPFFVKKDGWKRADEILLGSKIRVMPKIPNYIKKPVLTNFVKVKKSYGGLKEVVVPEYFTPELASLCGYIIGDGSVHKNGYRVNCYINEEETDLIEQLTWLCKVTFNIEPRYFVTNQSPQVKTIDDGNGLLREIISTQKVYNIEINSKQVTSCLSFLVNKRVPQQIFQSPKGVIAKFLAWLFEADGCAFGKGRGRTAIQLKSSTPGLLRDVQLLLLYFGIHSRIGGDNLYIRRAHDMELFIEEIGFISEKKRNKTIDILNVIKLRTQRRKKYQRWERVVKVELFGVMDVYDFEVPHSKCFIANGILCHNSGKSALLQFISKAAPKARFVSGKGATGAGLCVAPDSLIAMNPGSISKIKDLVESKLKNEVQVYKEGILFANNNEINKKIFTLDENLKIKPKSIEKYWKLNPPEYMVKLVTSCGKEIIATPNTKLFSLENGSLIWKEAGDIGKGDYLAGCREFKFENTNKILTITLIRSNPIVEGVKSHVKNMIKNLCKNREMTIRGLAKELCLNENKLYHHWVKKGVRGNIHLNDLLKLIELSNYNLDSVTKDITFLSLRKGHRMKIPIYLNEDFMYFAGLIAGDGDIDSKKGRNVIRFSNNSKELQSKFITMTDRLFGCKCYISSKVSNKRAESWRFGSNIVAEILDELGIPHSPKSHKIDMKNNLLSLPNNLLKAFLSGYFDADGGPVERKSGGHFIEVGSSSGEFAKKLQLVLLRFGVQSRLRVRLPKQTVRKDGKLIIAEYNKNIITIAGKKYLELFRDRVGFGVSEKKIKLDRIINSISYYHTNKDVIPGIGNIVKNIINKYHITSRQIFCYKTSNYFGSSRNFSIDRLKKVVLKLNELVTNKNDENLQKLNLLVNSDIIWEEVVSKQDVYNHGYEFVYDLTVGDSHNFIVNGVVVHNTATVVKDEFLRGWALEAGALVLANKGIAVVDELDKMTEEDRSALHQALEQQQVTISKANIQATLSAETTLLAAANPKLGRFDPYTPIASQIDLPPTLINRFDLIFPVRDIPSKERDEKIALHVLETAHKEEIYQTEVTSQFLRKYVAYAKQKIKPKLTKLAVTEIKDFYVSLRNSAKADDEGVKPIPISARQLEGLVRLAEASAKIRLDDKVTKEDTEKAIDLLKHCLMQVGFDPETGQIDIDRMSTGITASVRSKIIAVKEIILELDARGLKQIPIEEIMREAALKGIEESKVEDALDQLTKSGDIFRPNKNVISKIG